jgi:hypothetical protein
LGFQDHFYSRLQELSGAVEGSKTPAGIQMDALYTREFQQNEIAGENKDAPPGTSFSYPA